MQLSDIIILILVIIAVIAVGLYYLNRKMAVKMKERQDLIDRNSQVANIFVIDKKKDKVENVKLPKAVVDKLPKVVKMRKNYFVQAKIGPQIMTLMCDKKVFNKIMVKKNMKVELVGIYIMGVKGQK